MTSPIKAVQGKPFYTGDIVCRHDALAEINQFRHTVVEALPGGFVKLDPPSTGLAYWNVNCLTLVSRNALEDDCGICGNTGRFCSVCRATEENCQCPDFSHGRDCPYCRSLS